MSLPRDDGSSGGVEPLPLPRDDGSNRGDDVVPALSDSDSGSDSDSDTYVEDPSYGVAFQRGWGDQTYF